MKKIVYLALVPLSLMFIPIVSRANVSSEQTSNRVQSQTETFTGEISRYPSDRYPVPYVIYDQNRQENYFIDDSSKVANYDEKRVEIKGTLNKADNTIEVESVEPLN